MVWYQYLLGGILILLSIILTVVVLMQEGQSQGVTAVMGGGSDSFLSNTKSRSNQARVRRVTRTLAIVFFVVVLACFIILLFV